MGDFNAIYKILATLKDAMDYRRIEPDAISAKRLGVSNVRHTALLMMLVQAGYITGLSFDEAANGSIMMSVDRPRITLRGLEYLEESKIMKRVARTLHGITVL